MEPPPVPAPPAPDVERSPGSRPSASPTDPRPARVLLLFADGVGIGRDDPDRNPFLRAHLPVIEDLVGALPTLEDPRPRTGRAAAVALDATLGVDGTPQSGTGHTALLTGQNAARRFGRHFGPWVPVSLRPLLEEENLLRRAVEAGLASAFANAYPRHWVETRALRRPAGPPLAARAAGLLVRHAEHLARREAVASEILNDGWRVHLGHRHLPRLTPRETGTDLGRIAGRHTVTLYAHYGTDTAGHRGGMEGAVAALERLDAFLGGVLAEAPEDLLVILASDHGNVEDSSRGHTRNPALGLVAGPGSGAVADRLHSILDVTPALLDAVGVGASDAADPEREGAPP